MRIAQVAPLHVRVPPRLYGGTERVVHWITEGLQARGHDVTLFASGDSETTARLVAPCPQALWLESEMCAPDIYHTIELDMIRERAHEFDIIHSHLDFWLLPFQRHCPTPVLTTLHGRTDLPALQPLYSRFQSSYLVSISDAQRAFLPQANWVGTVWHGFPEKDYGFNPDGGDYLAFLGRMSPEKRPDMAIAVAQACGLPLKIAARISDFPPHFEWYKRVVEPMIATAPDVEFIGEVNDEQKYDLLRNAKALLAPIDWPEPFGLIFVEAWAVGTPVIARPCGSVPELVRHGVVGYVADTVEEMVEAVRRIDRIDRRACHDYFLATFTAPRMLSDYETIYERIVQEHRNRLSRRRGSAFDRKEIAI